MPSIKELVNVGRVTNPVEWLNNQLAKAQEWGFPYVPLVEVDSDFAKALLDRNERNRPLRERRAMRYRHDMQNGMWRTNGEAIIITSDGRMISGQHRAVAIADTDLVVPMFIAIGVPPESDMTVDQVAPKNAGDYLAMQGEPNAPTLAKIARLRLAFDANDREAIRDTAKPTNADVLQFVRDHHEDVERSANMAIELREYTKPLAAPSVVGFVHNVLHDIDAAPADQFIAQVAKGEEIKEGDAAYAVRSRLLAMGKAGIAKKAEVMFTGWNAFHAGRALKTIRVSGRLPALA